MNLFTKLYDYLYGPIYPPPTVLTIQPIIKELPGNPPRITPLLGRPPVKQSQETLQDRLIDWSKSTNSPNMSQSNDISNPPSGGSSIRNPPISKRHKGIIDNNIVGSEPKINPPEGKSNVTNCCPSLSAEEMELCEQTEESTKHTSLQNYQLKKEIDSLKSQLQQLRVYCASLEQKITKY